MTDRMGDALLCLIALSFAAIVLLTGCLGGPQNKMDGGAGNDTGQVIKGIEANAAAKVKVDQIAAVAEKTQQEVRASRDATATSIRGMRDYLTTINFVASGIFGVIVIGMSLYTIRSMKNAVCRYRVDRRLQQ